VQPVQRVQPAPARPPVAHKQAPVNSYEEAVNRFRIAPHFQFTFDDGDGSLIRPRQGMEQVKFHVTRGAGRGDWSAEVKPNGVVWTKDGQHAADVPSSLQQLYQRLTIFPDPQKKEGAAQRNGDQYEFTDANGGDRYILTVDAAGNIREMKIGGQTITIR
jgi:hypothetical protein